MRNGISRLLTVALLSGAAGLFVLGHPAEVRAQSAFFCPSGFSLQNGSCFGGKPGGAPGAFSGAAVASQALSELSETTTQETTRNTIDAVTKRRAQEEQRCADGFSRVDGTCQRNPPPVSEAAPIVPAGPPEKHVLKTTKKPKAAAVARKEAEAAPKIVRRAPLPPPALVPVAIEPAVRLGTWIQVYGDYEKRDATGPSFLNCCFLKAIDHSLTLDLQSRTGTVGFLAGADAASRDLVLANDGLIAGVTAGYVSSDFTLNTLTLSSIKGNRGGGSSQLHANLSGPTAGLYATYFDGGFSTDLTLRVDALTLDETVNDFIITSEQPVFHTFFVQGNGSVPLLNATIAGNLNYRFDLYPNFWIEPTVGAQYTNSSYGSSAAAQLGLSDGDLVMVQGGARVGTTTLINNHILMTTTVTGLAYDDVLVAGGFIPAAAFAGQNLLVQADQGQVRGRGILALNFDFGQGITSFVQGEARGGKGLFGAGGKAGVRYQW